MSVVFAELGVPSDFEGIVGLQLYGARRAYSEPNSFEIDAAGLDGAWLHLGELPEAYLRARALHFAWTKEILFLTVGGAKSHDEHVREELDAVRADKTLQDRPFALVVGWRKAATPQLSDPEDPEWGTREHARGLRLRDELQIALDRLAAGLALGLGDFLLDQIGRHTFWVAPSRPPTIVLGEFSASAELTATSRIPFPRSEVEEWATTIAALPEPLYNSIVEPLELVAKARAVEVGWLRFTLGWAALERLAIHLGSRYDDQLTVQERQPIIHRGRVAAVVVAGQAIIPDALPSQEQVTVKAMCLYALEVADGRLPGPYSDAHALAYAHAAAATRN